MTRRLLTLLLLACAPAAALGGLGALAEPALAACPPDRADVEQHTKRADDVFTGTVADRSVSGRTVTYTVAVDRIYKGKVDTEQVAVTADTRPARCGVPALKADGSYVFFTRTKGDRLTTDSRSGTARATAAHVADVETLLGEGKPAVPPVPVEATFTTVAGPRDDLQRIAAPGVALVIVGLLGLVLVAWRGRRRP